METKEYKIGETFNFNGVELKVIEEKLCHNCYFFENPKIWCDATEKGIPECTKRKRSDNKDVAFVRCCKDNIENKHTPKEKDVISFIENHKMDKNIQFADVYFMCTAILSHYGFDNQCAKTIEECNELCVALHHRNKSSDNLEVITEIADVLIMCLQLASHYGIDNVREEIKSKLERQIDRINKDEER